MTPCCSTGPVPTGPASTGYPRASTSVYSDGSAPQPPPGRDRRWCGRARPLRSGASHRSTTRRVDVLPRTQRAITSAFAAPVTSTMRAPARLMTSTPRVIRVRPWNSPIVNTGSGEVSARVASGCGAGAHDAVWPSSPMPRCTTSNRSGSVDAYCCPALSRSAAVTGIGCRSAGSAASWLALRSSCPSGAMRSSTCHTDTTPQPTAASAANAANSGGAVLPPLTASVAE